MINKIFFVILCIASLTVTARADECRKYLITKTQTLRLQTDAVTLQVKHPLPRKDFEDQDLTGLSCSPDYNAQVKDPDGNQIAVFYFSNLAPGSTVSIVMSYNFELKKKPLPPETQQITETSAQDYGNMREYLGDQGDIRITDEIRSAGQTITKDRSNPYLKARAIYDYIVANIRYENVDGTSGVQLPAEILNRKWGTCGDITKLFVALARSAGIPARPVAGYVFQPNVSETSSSSDKGHAWAEIYLSGYGWQSVDPTFGVGSKGKKDFFCFDNKTHIKEIYGQLYSRMTGTLYSGNRIEIRSMNRVSGPPVEAREIVEIDRLFCLPSGNSR